ncbi:MAG: hypothetical protein HYV60_18985 [Planctomycetia bacterium]|nr:hypothetical protein [Planctomycetia bacterium]
MSEFQTTLKRHLSKQSAEQSGVRDEPIKCDRRGLAWDTTAATVLFILARGKVYLIGAGPGDRGLLTLVYAGQLMRGCVRHVETCWPNAFFTKHGFTSLNDAPSRFVQSAGTY